MFFSDYKMSQMYLSAIDDIMLGPEKDRWEPLKSLQGEVKKVLFGPEKRFVLEEISKAFNVVKEERQRNAHSLEKMIDNLVHDEDGDPYEDVRQLLNDMDLYGSERKRLRRLFDKAEKSRADLEHNKLEEIVLQMRFSELSIPDTARQDSTDHPHIPPPLTETDLEPVNNIFSIIFNFGDRNAEFRKEQYQYIYACHEGISTKRDVVIEGPTGLGKTRALLAATIPALLRDPELRLVYSTRTVTQVNNIMDEIRNILEQNDLDITATLHIGSGRLRERYAKCYDPVRDIDIINKERAQRDPPLGPINEHYCNFNCSKFRSRFEPSFSLHSERLVSIDTLTETSQCPRGVMEAATKEARIVVLPHNYMYDSYWMQKYGLDKGLVIIDEAHNFLEDAAKNPYLTIGQRKEDEDPGNRQSNSYYLADLSRQFIRDCRIADSKQGLSVEIGNLQLKEAALYVQCLYNELSEKVKAHHNEQTKISNGQGADSFLIEDICDIIEELSDDFMSNLRSLARYFANAKQMASESSRLREGVKKGAYSYSQLLDGMIEIIDNPMDYMLVSCEGEFQFYSLHPKKNVERATAGFDSRIFTSATLSPTNDIAYLLGLRDPITSELESVFPAENYEHFYIVGANSSSKEEMREKDETFTDNEHKVIEEMLETAIDSAWGRNIGIFGNSIPVVVETHKMLKAIQSEYDFCLLPFIQGKRYSDEIEVFKGDYEAALRYMNIKKDTYTDEDVIEVFKALGGIERTAIILGVQGGTLSEGVDYKEEQMEMVIALGLPYPASASEIKLNRTRQDYFFMQGRDRQTAEDLTFKQVAYRKVAQSAGRAHRSMTDRAVVILADERMLGVKNVQNDLPNRYEYISPNNARKNMRLLQEPLQVLRKNIVMCGGNPTENRSLADYISSGLGVTRRDFIDLETMRSRIKEFYQ